jgi:hypothetical protein
MLKKKQKKQKLFPFIYSSIGGDTEIEWKEKGLLMYFTDFSSSTKIAGFDLDGRVYCSLSSPSLPSPPLLSCWFIYKI